MTTDLLQENSRLHQFGLFSCRLCHRLGQVRCCQGAQEPRQKSDRNSVIFCPPRSKTRDTSNERILLSEMEHNKVSDGWDQLVFMNVINGISANLNTMLPCPTPYMPYGTMACASAR